VRKRVIFVFLAVSSVASPELRAQAEQEQKQLHIPALVESRCGVAEDRNYGVTPGNPVKLGGGPAHAETRAKRFLHALRGLDGQRPRIKRLGFVDHTDGALLDMYVVEHDGIARRIYIDADQSEEPLAPADFVCGVALDLDGPEPEGLETLNP
jgi:hypothetical protein